MKYLVPVLCVVALLAGCTGKKDDPKTVTLGEFIKGKRIYLSAEGDGSHREKGGLAMQFDKDGSIVLAIQVAKGEFIREVSANSLHPTYKVDGLRVAVLNDGKETTGIQFSSANPKIGDKVSLGRDKGIISRIEKAGPFVFKEGDQDQEASVERAGGDQAKEAPAGAAGAVSD